MYCSNCGNQCKNGDRFCEKCGNPINTNGIIIENNQQSEDQETANLLTLIAIILFFPVPFFFNSLGYYGLNGISYLGALTLLIYTRVKYQKNIFAKVLMWIVIVLGILGAIAMLIFFISCSLALRDCQNMG